MTMPACFEGPRSFNASSENLKTTKSKRSLHILRRLPFRRSLSLTLDRFSGFRQPNTWFAFTSYCRATTDTDEPGANDAATISRFSASGHDRLRLPVPFVPITDFVDTSRPHNANDQIRLHEMKLFGKAVRGGGRPFTHATAARR